MADSPRAERSSDRSLAADTLSPWQKRHLLGTALDSHLVLRRLVPMCGLQDGDELPVLGVGPAADAWWREAR